MTAFACVQFADGSRCYLTAESWAELPPHWLERVVSVQVVAVAMRDPVAFVSKEA